MYISDMMDAYILILILIFINFHIATNKIERGISIYFVYMHKNELQISTYINTVRYMYDFKSK